VRLEDNPSYLNFPGDTQVVRYGEGLFIGYRAYDAADQQVTFPFGHGLSYTTFELADLAVELTGKVADDDLAATVTLSVTNTGPVAGAEVVQAYVGDVESEVTRPVRELKSFVKVWLEPGETRSIELSLDQRAFSFWSVRWDRWAVEEGDFEIAVGTSSRDLPLRSRVRVHAPSLAAPLTMDSTLQEWLGHSKVRQMIAAIAGQALTGNEELIKVVGTMPMSTLAAFGPLGFTRAKLQGLLDSL
jgi:beta-glucosidase